MIKKSILLVMWLSVLTAAGQSAREEIDAHPAYAGSNYCAYPENVVTQHTPAPEGYVPYYVSMYARHGSRWLCSRKEYEEPREVLERAHRCGALTAEGERVRAMVDSLANSAVGRYGELTPRGARQHRGIARRLVENYPTVFEGHTRVKARSTPVVRCILSMMAECGQLQAMRPQIEVDADASEADMWYLNNAFSKKAKELRYCQEANDSLRAFRSRHTPSERLMSVLFKNRGFVEDSMKVNPFVYRLFVLAESMQNVELDLPLLQLFTAAERYELWKYRNFRWYLQYANSPITHGQMPYTQTNLLREIMDVADTCLAQQHPGATLRFGHEVCVMPLACLMELDSCNVRYGHSDSLHEVFRNYKIYPMGSNVQLVFYRKDEASPVLVKVLLNERETRLPIKTEHYPYYDWEKLEAYYRAKLKDSPL